MTPHHFSSMLGFFPALVHRLAPNLFLTWGQPIATMTIDQSWLEKMGPKSMHPLNKPLITTTSNLQQGMVKNYVSFFFFTVAFTSILLLIK